MVAPRDAEELPKELTETASLAGREYAWPIHDFPRVLSRAAELGYACIGGQFQFRAPCGICEMYWLEADSGGRREAEPWGDYVVRARDEVSRAFQRICAQTDFRREAEGWDCLREQMAAGSFDPLGCLRFVAYFSRGETI